MVLFAVMILNLCSPEQPSGVLPIFMKYFFFFGWSKAELKWFHMQALKIISDLGLHDEVWKANVGLLITESWNWRGWLHPHWADRTLELRRVWILSSIVVGQAWLHLGSFFVCELVKIRRWVWCVQAQEVFCYIFLYITFRYYKIFHRDKTGPPWVPSN